MGLRRGLKLFRTTMSGEKIYEGVFAVHKPQDVSSAGVIRDLQRHFNPSKTFEPWISTERERRDRESQFQRRRRRQQKVEVKIGHGGTLDPMATGVLVAGVGKGTKFLNNFLGCTKSYETVILFGAETDTYDRLGKIVRRGPYEHITREAVEKALDQFRGKIMQRPPIFSALKVQGKPMYQYAREGKEIPIEIKERPVEVNEMRIVEWHEPGTHEYKWPEVEAAAEEKEVVEKLLAQDDTMSSVAPVEGVEPTGQAEQQDSSTKRKSPPPPENPKEGAADGAASPAAEAAPAKKQKVSAEGEETATTSEQASTDVPEAVEESTSSSQTKENASQPQPAAVKIVMTVTSGFYVRTFAHDLGRAVGSCGLMSSLIRTRQGDFELDPEKVLEYRDLEAGEEVWGPKVKGFLDQWEKKRAAEEGHN